jgi:hypothetical protein
VLPRCCICDPESRKPQKSGSSLKPGVTSQPRPLLSAREAAAWTTATAQQLIRFCIAGQYTASALEHTTKQQSSVCKSLLFFSPADDLALPRDSPVFLPSSIQEQVRRPLKSARAPTSSPHQEQETLQSHPSITPYPTTSALIFRHIYRSCLSLVYATYAIHTRYIRRPSATTAHYRQLPPLLACN